MGEFIIQNWYWILVLILLLFEVVARLTPTEKDNEILKVIQEILNGILPNRNKAGGTFSPYQEGTRPAWLEKLRRFFNREVPENKDK